MGYVNKGELEEDLGLILIIARKYGDVVSLKVFHQTIISINSPSLMRELLERRSVTSSNRPKNTLTEIITPGNLNMGTAHLRASYL